MGRRRLADPELVRPSPPDGLAPGPHRVLRPDGSLTDRSHRPPPLPLVLEGLRLMLLSRCFDRRAQAMNRQGRLGGAAPGLGQEAAVVGSALAIDPARDWIAPQYRELAALVRHGRPLDSVVAHSLGQTDAARVPDGVRVLPDQYAIAAHLPHAVGLAWGLALQDRDGVVIAYFGEGASSEGDFHEACNLAGVVRAPVVFFLQDNGWAISTPRSAQSAAVTLAARAAGYGFEGVTVDGNDLLAVYEVTIQAVARARAGAGPTLVEALTYRLGVHNMSDDPRRYRDGRSEADAARLDPVVRVQGYLRRYAGYDEESLTALERDAEREVEAAIASALAAPRMTRETMFEHAYARPPARLVRQRAAALRASGDASCG